MEWANSSQSSLGEPLLALILYSILVQQPKRHTNFPGYSCSDTELTWCTESHTAGQTLCSWTRNSTRTSLYSMSRCHHCQLNCEVGHSTTSLNHCSMIASFWKRLGSKLAAHRHHGKAPAVSWFQVRTSKRSFIMAQTPPWLQSVWGSFGGLSSPFSSQKAASIPNNTSLVDSKFQNAIPEMEPLMYPPVQHIAFDLGYI